MIFDEVQSSDPMHVTYPVSLTVLWRSTLKMPVALQVAMAVFVSQHQGMLENGPESTFTCQGGDATVSSTAILG